MSILGYEAQLIVNLLKTAPDSFFSGTEIARKAGQKGQFRTDPHWARPILARLVDEAVIETDAFGHFRLARKPQPKATVPLAPHVAEALARSEKVFDLTSLYLEPVKAAATGV